MYGMRLVIPISLFLLLLFGLAAVLIGYVVVIVGIPSIVGLYTLILVTHLDFRTRRVGSIISILAAVGIYLFFLDVARYLIFFQWRSLPLGRPMLDTFGTVGVTLYVLGLFIPLILLKRNWHRQLPRYAGSVGTFIPTALGLVFFQTAFGWPLMALVSHIFNLNFAAGDNWWWSWLLVAPLIALMLWLDL